MTSDKTQVRDEHWAGVVVRHGTCGCGIGWSFGVHVISAYEVGEFGLTFVFPNV